jgi:hypothetical protein
MNNDYNPFGKETEFSSESYVILDDDSLKKWYQDYRRKVLKLDTFKPLIKKYKKKKKIYDKNRNKN